MDRFLFDLNPNPILIHDTESLRILNTNDAFVQKYGYSESEINALTIEDIRPKEKLSELRSVLEGLNNEGDHTKKLATHQSKNGEIFYVNISSHPYHYKDKSARVVFIHDVTEQVKAEEKAQQTLHELHHHLKESPLAMVKWDEQFRVTQWSKRAREIMGFSEEQVMGKTPDFLHFPDSEDRVLVEDQISEVLSGKRDKAEFEARVYNNEGSLIYLRINGSALRDEDGKLISMLTFMEDITEQKRAERRYQRLFENANDGIFLMKGSEFIECNDEVAKIYGCEKDEILGATPIDFSPERQPDGQKSSEKALKKINKALDGESQVFEWKHRKKNGTPIDVEVSLNRLKLGSEVFIQAIVRDLTEQKKAQEKLRRSEELFRKLFLKAPGALIMVDKENRVKMVNKSFEDLFGYTEEELLGKDIDKEIVPEEEYNRAPRMPGNEFREGRFYEDVVRYTKGGEPRDILLGAIPVYLDNEPIAGFGIYIDVTEQKENERKLKESLDEKQVLLEEIHHRVKNNLAIISGLLQLQAFEAADEETRNALNDSQLRIQSIGIVHELLYQSENFIDISFEEYINKLVGTVKNTLPFDHQHIDINIETGDVSLDINQAIPSAILINELVTNAYKHAFGDEDSGSIWIRLKENNDEIMIIVEDDGAGLPEEFSIQDHSSIGMNLIQTLTQQLDGTLDYSSTEQGAYFSVQFKRNEQRDSDKLYLLQG